MASTTPAPQPRCTHDTYTFTHRRSDGVVRKTAREATLPPHRAALRTTYTAMAASATALTAPRPPAIPGASHTSNAADPAHATGRAGSAPPFRPHPPSLCFPRPSEAHGRGNA